MLINSRSGATATAVAAVKAPSVRKKSSCSNLSSSREKYAFRD